MSSIAIAVAIATLAAILGPSAGVAEVARASALPPATTEGAVPSAQPAPASDPRTNHGAWVWPVGVPHPIARPFVAPATPYSSGHRGIDIRAPSPDVFAPADGVVSFAGMVAGRPVLSIRHPGGLVSSFEPVSAAVPAGTVVSRGQLVGTLLPGHCASTLCVHFGVRLDGEYVSPLNYLGSIPRAILLPTR